MRLHFYERCFRIFAGLWLIAQVHFDALQYDPFGYLTAVKWRILRKRVRALSQMAPLLSQSPKAYQLWLTKHSRAEKANDLVHALPPIVALVETPAAGRASEALKFTLDSLAAEGMMVLLIGADQSITAAASVIDWQTEPWLMPLMAGDCVIPGTAVAYRTALAKAADQKTRLCYADDDQINCRGERSAPHFKPDWNSELFRHFDYLTGACIVKASRDDLQAVAEQLDWARLLIARIAKDGLPIHVRQVLHNRIERIMPSAVTKPVVKLRDAPPVTVIVPIRNRVHLLRTCLGGLAATDYPKLDVIIVDNDSDDPETLAYLAALDPARATVMRHSGPFNYSAINNRAAARARGKLLCLLNNDIEVIEPSWLATMVAQASRNDVGAVGARLLYPDGRIQHAGVVIGVGNAAGHAHRFIHPDEQGYFRRHALPHFASAVTAACLVVQRERFMAVGGLDERNFAVAFNDVDLCLRLNQRGWQSLYEPRATLIHHESVSRGLDRDPIGAARFAEELAALKRIWKTNEVYDPYHHPQLSRVTERFAFAI